MLVIDDKYLSSEHCVVESPAPLIFRYSWLHPLPLCVAPFLKDTCVGAADVVERRLVSLGSFCCFNSFLLLIMGIFWEASTSRIDSYIHFSNYAAN